MPWGSWADCRRRSAPTKRSSASNRGASRPSLTSLAPWPASSGPNLARAALQEAIDVSPWRSDYRLALARICAQAGDWPGAVAACREAIRLNPDLLEARSLLVQCYLRSGASAEADAEFRTLLLFDPASREVWQRWYERQKQEPRQGGPPASGKPPA